jgi:hypothetical protein
MNTLWKQILRWLPGAVISLVLLGIILHLIDLGAVWASLKKANPWFLLLSLACSIIWLLVRVVMWKTLLQNKPSYKVTFFTLSEGYLMNNFLPFRLGEVGRAFLLSRKTGTRFMEVIPTIVIERAVDLMFSAGILFLSVPFVMGVSGAGRLALFIGGIMLAGLIGLFILAQKQDWVHKLFQKLSLRYPKLQKFSGKILDSFFSGLFVLTDLRTFFRFIFWITLAWLIAIGQFYILVKAFFPQANLTWAMFALGAAAFGGAIPSLPGSIGTLDAAVGGAIALLTNNIDTTAAFVIVMRMISYLVTGIPALIALGNEGTTLAGLYRDVTRFRSRKDQIERSE